jgi:hypothetical protein
MEGQQAAVLRISEAGQPKGCRGCASSPSRRPHLGARPECEAYGADSCSTQDLASTVLRHASEVAPQEEPDERASKDSRAAGFVSRDRCSTSHPSGSGSATAPAAISTREHSFGSTARSKAASMRAPTADREERMPKGRSMSFDMPVSQRRGGTRTGSWNTRPRLGGFNVDAVGKLAHATLSRRTTSSSPGAGSTGSSRTVTRIRPARRGGACRSTKAGRPRHPTAVEPWPCRAGRSSL